MKKNRQERKKTMNISLVVIAIFIIFALMINIPLISDLLSCVGSELMKNKYFKNYLVMYEIKNLDAIINFNENNKK